MTPRARLNLTPNLLSPPKHVNSDWVRVWDENVAKLVMISIYWMFKLEFEEIKAAKSVATKM